MVFATVSGDPTEKETEELTGLWQGSLFNANYDIQRCGTNLLIRNNANGRLETFISTTGVWNKVNTAPPVDLQLQQQFTHVLTFLVAFFK